MRFSSSALIFILMGLFAHTCVAQVVAFNTFGPDDEYSQAGTWFGRDLSLDKTEVAQRIVPLHSGYLQTIVAAITTKPNVVVDLKIHAEENGRPGNAILWEQSFTDFASFDEIANLQVTNSYFVEAGVPIWLSAGSPTLEQWRPATWWVSDTKVDFPAVRGGVFGNSWFVYTQGNADNYAVRILVIPEPSTLALLCMSAIFLWYRR